MQLYLCEKPSQARDIAKFIGVTNKQDGYLSNQDGSITVTWGFGHLLEMAPPENYNADYKKWNLEHLPIIPSNWHMLVKKESTKQFKVIKSLVNKANDLIIATDPDREGEAIAREILDICSYQGKIRRLWLSSLVDDDIRKALNVLKADSETKLLYYAGLGRARADWLVGMNLTRLFTLLGRSNGLQTVLTVGRVQSPTLAIVVNRDREIKNFVSKPYWTLTLKVAANNSQEFKAMWQPPEEVINDASQCIDKNAITEAENYVRTNPKLKVISVETKRAKESHPLCFDLGSLQIECSKKWGMGAKQVLDIAQSLYEKHKATTYPRTDCGYLSEAMYTEVPKIISAIEATDPNIKNITTKLDLSIKSRTFNDKKITAHHGIIPTTARVNLSNMNHDEQNVYALIRSYFLSQFLKVYEVDKTVVMLKNNRDTFIAKGNLIIVNGWKALFNNDFENSNDTSDLQQLPKVIQNEILSATNTEIKALETKPPAHFTEGTLISAMKNAAKFVLDERLKSKLRETEGLGTEATRAGIIDNLIQRGFLITKKKSLLASDAAYTLIDALPDIIKDPGMTALWEQALNDIACGNMTLDMFMQKQSDFINFMINKFKTSTLKISKQQLKNSPNCPECQSIMLQRKSTNGPFWGCSKYPNCKGLIAIGKTKSKRKPAASTKVKAGQASSKSGDIFISRTGKKVHLGGVTLAQAKKMNAMGAFD